MCNEYIPVANEEKETVEERTFDPEAFAAALDCALVKYGWAAGIEQLSLNETLEVLRRNLSPVTTPNIPGLGTKETYQASITEIDGQEHLANASELPVYTQRFTFTFRGDLYSRPFSHYKRDHAQLRRDMAASFGSTWRQAFRTIKVVAC